MGLGPTSSIFRGIRRVFSPRPVTFSVAFAVLRKMASFRHFSKKKEKRIVTQNYLSSLPEDVLLLVLQYSQVQEIENTRPFQTTWVNKCTMFVSMEKAFQAQNLHNMKWIKGRKEGRFCKLSCYDYFEFGRLFSYSDTA